MAQAPVFLSRIVTVVAIAGLAPFVATLAVTLHPPLLVIDPVIFERAMLGYGALILSFLGGVRWGLRLQGGAGSDLTFIVGIFGSIAGFITLLLPFTLGLLILTIGFALQGAWDVWSSGLPAFYARLRSIMTWLVCFVLLAILILRTII